MRIRIATVFLFILFLFASSAFSAQTSDVAPDEQSTEKASEKSKRSGLFEMSTHHRPVLLISDKVDDASIFTDFTLSYLGAAFFVNFNLKPAVFTFTDGDFNFSFAVAVEGGYNGKWFAVGAGVGVDEILSYWDVEQPGLLVTVPLRIGKKDGIHLDTTTGFVWHMGRAMMWEDSDFRFGVPLLGRFEIFVEGAAGRKLLFNDDYGRFYAGVGLGFWINGRGEAGSVRFDAAVGAGGIWEESTSESFGGHMSSSGDWIADPIEYSTKVYFSVGPMISLGLTWRF